MNRSLIFALIISGFYLQANAQGNSLCQQVVAAAGKNAQQGNRYFSYTVGEPFILTLSSATQTLTQGFHQPEICKLVATDNIELAPWGIEVFPNPTTDFLTVRFEPQAGERLYAQVYDLMGRMVLTSRTLDQPAGTKLDCSDWQPGIYFLQLTNASGTATATHRLVRL